MYAGAIAGMLIDAAFAFITFCWCCRMAECCCAMARWWSSSLPSPSDSSEVRSESTHECVRSVRMHRRQGRSSSHFVFDALQFEHASFTRICTLCTFSRDFGTCECCAVLVL